MINANKSGAEVKDVFDASRGQTKVRYADNKNYIDRRGDSILCTFFHFSCVQVCEALSQHAAPRGPGPGPGGESNYKQVSHAAGV